VWRLEGSLPDMGLKRVMTVIRRADGRLVIHNGIAVDESTLEQLRALGEPAFLVVPNGYHRLDAAAWKERFPEIRVVCPEGARKKVEQKVPVDLGYRDFPGDEVVTAELIDGVAEGEGAFVVRSADGVTLVLNDVVFNMPHLEGIEGLVLRWVTASTGGPRVTRLARWAIVKDRRALRAHLLRLAELPGMKRIIVSHHIPIVDDAAATLRQVAETL
jgi:hypothetical protein